MAKCWFSGNYQMLFFDSAVIDILDGIVKDAREDIKTGLLNHPVLQR